MDKLRMKSSDASDGNVAKVVVYAKLPRSFHIPTPVGNYAPVWAIAMNKGEVKHIFFIAETKGLLLSMQLNAIENAKIDCCKQLVREISTDNSSIIRSPAIRTK